MQLQTLGQHHHPHQQQPPHQPYQPFHQPPHHLHHPQQRQPAPHFESPFGAGDHNNSAVQVQWDKSWDQNLEVSGGVSKFPALPTPSGRAASLSIPKNLPFLAKITSVGKTVRLLCKECGESKSIVYKTKFTLKVGVVMAEVGVNGGGKDGSLPLKGMRGVRKYRLYDPVYF